VTGRSAGVSGLPDYATIKYSNTGLALWTNRYNGPADWDDTAYAVVVDDNNDVIVTGGFWDIGAGLSDYATIKYSSSGVPLWSNRYDGPLHGDDGARAAAVDRNNDVVVTGQSQGSDSSTADYATIKYSSGGEPLWTNRYNGPSNDTDSARAVAVDGNNDVIVTGSSTGSGTYDFDYTTIKYSSAGVPLWTNRYNGAPNKADFAAALKVDGSNNVIVTGTSGGVGSLGDYATIKYSSEGVPLWTNRYNGPANSDDWVQALVVDSSNNLIVTGYSWNGSSRQYATIKYSSEGVPVWTNRYNGPGNFDVANAVAVDGSDNVIVTGYSLGSVTSYDYATIKYSSTGVPLWTNRYNGTGNDSDIANAVTVDRSRNVIVTGTSVQSGGDWNFATIKYLCVPSPVVTGRITNGTFQLRVEELLQPGTLVIEASTSLSANPPGWSPVFTNTTPTNVLFYTDPDAANAPTRFYRAFQSP
jgi:hypothetical protein